MVRWIFYSEKPDWLTLNCRDLAHQSKGEAWAGQGEYFQNEVLPPHFVSLSGELLMRQEEGAPLGGGLLGCVLSVPLLQPVR